MGLRGQIDVAKPGSIDGWAFQDGEPAKTVELEACINGRRVASCLANNFRQDLLQAGLGTGAYGFHLELPELLMRKNVIDLRDAGTGEILPGSPVDLREDNEQIENSSAAQNPWLFIDISDLIWHMDTYPRFTGIPRVVSEIVGAIFQYGLYDMSRIILLDISYPDYQFKKVSVSSFLAIMEKYRNGAIQGFQEGGELLGIEHLLEYEHFEPSEYICTSGILLSLGSACWGISNYFSLVRKLVKRGCRFIPLFHDLIPLMMPELAPPHMNGSFNLFIRRCLRTASAILTVSSHCAEDTRKAAAQIGYECPSISVVGNGCSQLGEPGRNFLPRPYILCVGTIERRKNQLLLVRAWLALVARHGDRMPDLVFVGRIGEGIEAFIDVVKASGYFQDRLWIITEADDRALATLYHHCLFTAYPSFYEGWGLPISESLAFGKTCLCSNASALPEAGEDFCVYFDPHDLTAAVTLAERLIFEPGFREKKEREIREKYAPAQWPEIAKKIIELAISSEKTPPRYLKPMEYIFIPPDFRNTVADNALGQILSFEKGILSTQKVGWDNYALAEELLAGVFTQAGDINGILAKDGCLDINIPLEHDIGEANIFIVLASRKTPVQVNVYHFGALIGQERIKRRKVLRLAGVQVQKGSEICFRLMSVDKKPFWIASILIAPKNQYGNPCETAILPDVNDESHIAQMGN